MIVELSEHFTWAEASVTIHRDIDNEIPPELYANIQATAKAMERVRALLNNHPITISSWYRCPELNIAVKGSKVSQHMRGLAVDFICPKFGSPVRVAQQLLRYPEIFEFDQLILEHTWVHLGFKTDPKGQSRRQVLSLLKPKGYANGLTTNLGEPIC